MATLTILKKKIAALEAQVERVTKAEVGNAIAKIRKIMGDYGVTVEHLVDGTKHTRATGSKKSTGAKPAKTSKGKKPAKYMDPKSGATWSGLGRIPAWIAKAKNRDVFLIGKPAVAEAPSTTSAPKLPTKRQASKKTAKAVRSGGRAASKVAAKRGAVVKKATPTKQSVPPAPAKQARSKKVAAKTPATKKGSASATAPAPARDAGADAT